MSLKKIINKYQKFLVTMHVNPDPDAIGSALALALYLKSQGKRVCVVNETPCPSWLQFMPALHLYQRVEQVKNFKADVAVVLDAGDLSRIGSVQTLIKKDVTIVNIDHHVTNTYFGDLNIVKEGYSSTAEILYGVLKSLKGTFNRQIATLLYVGILTDTGSFGFDSTKAHTHTVIADLMQFNLPVGDLYREVYEVMPKVDLKNFLMLMSTLTLHYDEKVACLLITKKQLKGFSDEFDVKDKVFSFLRSIKGLEVIVILTQQEENKSRINFRSRQEVDVAAIASQFNGGGHKKASGCLLEMNLLSAKKKILSVIGKVL